MEKIQSIGFIGGGNMALALAKGMKGHFSHLSFYCTDPAEDRKKLFQQEINKEGICSSIEEICEKSQLLFICVKPQVWPQIASSLKEVRRAVVSIMAGVSLKTLCEAVPLSQVIRVMPNTGCLVGAMAAGLSCSKNVSSQLKSFVGELLASSGKVIEVDESLMDAVTGVSGSGPAFVARLIDYFIQSGVKQGLSLAEARVLVRQTFEGTVRFLNETGMDEESLIKMVSSPGGTTLAGRGVLESSEAAQIIQETVSAAVKRSQELGRM